jgi:hypothetical protein
MYGTAYAKGSTFAHGRCLIAKLRANDRGCPLLGRKHGTIAMTKIQGFEGGCEIDLDEVVTGSPKQIRTLLERLVARHVMDRKIIDDLQSGAHFNVHRDRRPGKPMQLSTMGTWPLR